MLSTNDDAQFLNLAKNSVIPQIISSQSADVDTVSGATFSSNGIIEAVANALNVSYTNPNSQIPQKGHGGKALGDPKRP